MQFNNTPLAIDENNHVTKIANACIIYDLDNPLINFVLKNCLLGATNTVKNRNKSRYVYKGQKITFYVAGSLSFGNDFAKNVGTFGTDNWYW